MKEELGKMINDLRLKISHEKILDKDVIKGDQNHVKDEIAKANNDEVMNEIEVFVIFDLVNE